LATPKLEKDEKDMTATEKRLGHSQPYQHEGSPVSLTNLHTILTQGTGSVMPSVPDSPHGPVEDRHVGRRVLLADDNATNLEVLSRMLQLEKVVDVQLAMVSTLACLKPRWNRADRYRTARKHSTK
jgi:hypothetical protein